MTFEDRTLFSESELREMIGRGEGQFLELKSLWDRSGDSRRALDRRTARDFVAVHLAAFANADGGTLVLGVEDDGTPSGHRFPTNAVADLIAVPERRLRPAVRCQFQRAVLDGHELLVLQVPMAPEAVMVEGNGFPYRVGDHILREPQEVINARKETYRRVGFEQRIRVDATIEDLDLELASRFFAGTVFKYRSAEEVLARFGLILRRTGTPAVTNAALILFGKPPVARWHPCAGIRFFRVSGVRRRHGGERNVTQLSRIDPPTASAIPDAYRQAREHVRRSEKLHDLFFREMPEYPDFAWQEAIVNAFAHRDYEDQGREIEVWFYEDRMEVKSPGDLVPPVTLELLQSRTPVHASRNPLIVRLLVEAGLMREEGEGIARMFDEMEASYLHGPELDLEAGGFTVTLRNEPIFTGVDPEWRAIVDRLPVSLAQKRVLLAHPDGFTNEDYRRLNAVDRDEAYRKIQELVEMGIALPAASTGPGAIYPVAREVAGRAARRNARNANAKNAFSRAQFEQAPEWAAERVETLRAYFAEHASLKNADYREMLDLDRNAAFRELRWLTRRGYLRMEGAGRGTRYVPGPELEES